VLEYLALRFESSLHHGFRLECGQRLRVDSRDQVLEHPQSSVDLRIQGEEEVVPI
jgi:hypothetical protein